MTRMNRLAICILVLVSGVSSADAQLLSTHYPEPSTNAALHYNRALLSLSYIPLEERQVLGKPIWESFGSADRNKIKASVEKLTHVGRHAIRAALKGTSCARAEFGVDYSDYGHGVELPHCQPMLELGRLVTLAGIYAQIQERWDESATLFFEGLRMGRHMAGQPTLAESIVGVQILENNYFALSFWGSKCPDSRLVTQAFLRFEAATDGILRPAFTLANEASIIERQMDRLRSAYPDGPWAQMILDSLGEPTLGIDSSVLAETAKQKCVEAGVPAAAFNSKENFDKYVSTLSSVRANYFRSLAACVTLAPSRRHAAASNIYNRAKAQLSKLSKDDLLNPDDLVSVFATHEAERTMARVALAVASSRTGDSYPKTLASVAPRFSGQVPKSPYDGSEIKYQLLDGGKAFGISVSEAKSGNVTLPQVDFSSLVK